MSNQLNPILNHLDTIYYFELDPTWTNWILSWTNWILSSTNWVLSWTNWILSSANWIRSWTNWILVWTIWVPSWTIWVPSWTSRVPSWTNWMNQLDTIFNQLNTNLQSAGYLNWMLSRTNCVLSCINSIQRKLSNRLLEDPVSNCALPFTQIFPMRCFPFHVLK
jgi:hypothetical protein